MARFRRSGTNWEGRRWYTSVGLNALMDEIEAAWPQSHSADGTVASKTHDANNPTSDHRPYPYTASPGIVRAVDAGEYVEGQGSTLAEALRKSRDPRIKYVIHEGRMFASYSKSSRPAWAWGTYTGPNPHTNHVHVSVNEKADKDGSAWNLGLGGAPAVDQGEDIVLKRGMKGAAVKKAQSALMAERSGALPKYGADGSYGAETEAAVKDFQTRWGLPVTGMIDGVTMSLLMEYAKDAVGGGSVDAYTKAESDARYARLGHTHKATVTLS